MWLEVGKMLDDFRLSELGLDILQLLISEHKNLTAKTDSTNTVDRREAARERLLRNGCD